MARWPFALAPPKQDRFAVGLCEERGIGWKKKEFSRDNVGGTSLVRWNNEQVGGCIGQARSKWLRVISQLNLRISLIRFLDSMKNGIA